MSLATAAATQSPARRRTRLAAEATMGVDSRHRRSAARRKAAQAPVENPAMHYGLPDGFVNTGMILAMAGIVALHHRTLLDALFSLFA
ncbi:hypothetical protein [Solimonas fluminis]|nr:hypothetical protein [Solimonas fluminis]